MKIVRTGEEGFTLIEVLIAITIFAIGLLAVAGMQLDAIHYDTKANARVVGTAVAQSVLADIMSKDPSDTFFNPVSGLTLSTPTSTSTFQKDYTFPSTSTTTLTVGTATGQGADTYTATYTFTKYDTSGVVVQVKVSPSGDQNSKTSLTGYKRLI